MVLSSAMTLANNYVLGVVKFREFPSTHKDHLVLLLISMLPDYRKSFNQLREHKGQCRTDFHQP